MSIYQLESKFYQPRPYQVDCLAALAEARANGIKKGLVVMASGLGKTLTAVFDLQQFLQEYPNARVLYLCHKESILLQAKPKFQQVFGAEYSYGLYTGNYKTGHAVNFLFATFQTMRDHREEFLPDAFDYVIVDEAHHTAADTYQPTADYIQPRFLLGLTATKDRMDGQDILDTYEQVLYQMDIYDGWDQGWLARVDYRIMLDDLNEEEFQKYVGPHTADEKVSLAQLNRTIFAPQHDEGIVASIREQTSDLHNPRIFIFCSGIDHANTMADCFGGEAAVVHSKQSSSVNQAILSEFACGNIRIIISVDMLNEGIDVPETDVVVFLRATESTTVFFQQLGRGLRIGTEKRTVRVLDYVANIERISTILEMDETAKQRITTSNTDAPVNGKPAPIVVDIPATKFKVERVDIECLLRRVTKRRSYKEWSREEIIQSLRSHADGEYLPTYEYIRLHANEMPPICQIMLQFHTTENLAEACHLKPNRIWRTEDEIVYQYYMCCKERKRWLTAADFARLTGTRIHSCKAVEAIGGIQGLRTKILEVYGDIETIPLESHEKAWNQDYSVDDIIAAVQSLTRRIRRPPGKTDLEQDPFCPDYSTCRMRLGGGMEVIRHKCGVENILRELGVATQARQGLTDAEMSALQDFVRQEQRRVKVRDLTEGNIKNGPSLYIVSTYVGSIDDLNKLIGADELILYTPPLRAETVAWLQGIVREKKRPLKSKDFPMRNDGFKLSYDKVKRSLQAKNIGVINAFIGADQILAELAAENN